MFSKSAYPPSLIIALPLIANKKKTYRTSTSLHAERNETNINLNTKITIISGNTKYYMR